jgi:hypothetical protein
MASRNGDTAVSPCPFCMSMSSRVVGKAQLVLFEGRWQPWPLVSPLPDAPMVLADVCPACDRERFNAEEVPRLNRKLGLVS